ncbi:hypothetical protein ABW19_dt0207511 [Dactylella cylindrospora]|nr:hypothetical protein ABW19_dt0207511 [Dactylella cylindrospora]
MLSNGDVPPELLKPMRFSTTSLPTLPSTQNITVAIYPSTCLPPTLPALLLPIINRAFSNPLFPYLKPRYDDTADYLQELKSNGDIAWVFVAFIHPNDQTVSLDLKDFKIPNEGEEDADSDNSDSEDRPVRPAATLILKIGSENPDEPNPPSIPQGQSEGSNLADLEPDEPIDIEDPFRCLFIQGLSVSSDLHGRGLGSFLMAEMEKFVVSGIPLPISSSLNTPKQAIATRPVKRLIHAHLIREVASNEKFYKNRGYVLQSVHWLPKGTWKSIDGFHLLAKVKKVTCKMPFDAV